MKLYLIRHGQTDWNVAQKIQGGTDVPLNETGRRQAACLAKGMEYRPTARIYSSRLKRAVETAQIIADSKHMPVEIIDGLEEVDFGEWEGRTLEEIERLYPQEYTCWQKNPVIASPPGGETPAQIRRRCRQAMETILSQAPGDFVIVSHGAILAHLIQYLTESHPLEKQIIVENSSITTFQYAPHSQEFTIVQQNDTAHLVTS